MAESMRRWVSEHKLRTVGCLWLSGITGSIAYNWSRPTMKTSVKLIHARLHAQALTLAALVGAAAIDYLDHDNAPTKNDPVGAKGIGVPLLNPYLNKDAIFTHGVNFAVAGATALQTESLAAENMTNPPTNSSLSVQLDWMWSYFNSICYNTDDCVEKLRSALFIVGEVGSYDYYYALSQGKTMEDVKNMVSDVVHAILYGARRVIDMGASKVIVEGMFPLGCFPAYVSAAFPAKYTPSYDEHRCSIDLNNLSISHNDQLRWGVQQLSQEHQNITILYGDHYAAFIRLLQNAPRFGFNAASDVKTTCCGIGRWDNFNPSQMCGHRGVPVCGNPDAYVIWDGLNLTHKANRLLARWLIRSTISHV